MAEHPTRRKDDRWHVSREVSISNILAVLSALVAIAGAYVKLDGRISLLELDKAYTAAQLSEIRALLHQVNAKLDETILREIQRGGSH